MDVAVLSNGTVREVSLDLDPEQETIASLAAAITGSAGGAGLLVDGRFFDASTPLAQAGLRHGSVIQPASGPDGAAAANATLELRVVGGTDGGRRLPLTPGPHVIGRGDAEVDTGSRTVSPTHARLDVSPSGEVVLTDLGSRNGTVVEGYRLPGSLRLEPDQVAQLGAVQLTMAPTSQPDRPQLGAPRRTGTVTFNRQPRSAVRPAEKALRLPAAIREPSAGVRFSLMQVGLPAVFGIGMGIMVNPAMMGFALLSPAMAVGNYLQDKKRLRKETSEGKAEAEQTLEQFRRSLVNARRAEIARLRERLPDPSEVVRRATAPSTHLWERRRNHDDFLQLRLGTATVDWTPPLDAPGSFGATEPPPDVATALSQLGKLPLAPLGLDLTPGNSLGVVGDRAVLRAVLRSLVCQAAVHHGPADLRIAILTEPARVADWDWAKWLPHTASLDEASGRRMLASSPGEIEGVLNELSAAAPAAGSGFGTTGPPAGPVTLVVIDADGLTEGRNSHARELLGGTGAPVAGIVVAGSVDRLPAVCTRIAEINGADGAIRYREPATRLEIPDVLAAGLTEPLARACARALAGFEDPEVAVRGADLPDRASLLTLLGIEPTPEAVLGRWRQAGKVPGISGPIGVAETGPLTIDLVSDGPHSLIAGTTGAGKSELLRSMVASWAASVDPEHLNFVLIDYKGGSAFAQCATLPHTVGMVTDLDEHLGQRALRCLEAELRYREQRLRDAGVSDLKEYLAAGHPEPLPRLVVIIDEFATMVAELPDFIDSLVGIAQRGRSLGVHMILATQRPGGAVNNSIRANTNLRISLRVQDVAESVDVLNSPLAASIARYQAGRGYVRLGPAEVFPFQAALVTGTTVAQESTGIGMTDFGFGPEPPRPAPAQAPTSAGDIPSDLERLVAAAATAARSASMAVARRPWPEPLPAQVLLADLTAEAPESAPLAVAVGLADDPDRQRQIPFFFDPAAGNLLLYGVSGAGTTTALATLALGLAEAHPVERLHLYVLDFGTQALAPLAELPHVGAVVGSSDRDRQTRLLRFLSDEIDRRRQWMAGSGAGRVNAGLPGSPFPLIGLLLDNFGAFASEDSSGTVRDQLARLVADGPGLGIIVVATADRPATIPSAISNLVTQKLVFRLGETQDFSYFGIAAREVPKLTAGRAIDVASRLEVQLALPGDAGLASAVNALCEKLGPVSPEQGPAPIGVLPDDVTTAKVESMLVLNESAWTVPLGIGDNSLGPVGVRLHEGEHLLVTGPSRSGKSTTLDAVAALVAGTRPDVVISVVALRRSPLAETPGVRRLARTAEEMDAVLQELLADPAPQLLLVDDCDSVDDPRNLLSRALDETRVDLHVVAAGRADALRQAYGHWTQGLRRSRIGLALKPDMDRDGDMWGASLPRKGPDQFPPGRGYLVVEGQVELTQAVHR
ncbi:MAG: segregation ATPase FtsK/SpoIIIE, family [Actinomycetota bacterium]|nr:segregation ATPase FtsK/SpoIIIE, family [Actinomycetota bacterium]